MSYYYYAADGDEQHTRFLGLAYLATMEIITSDYSGQKQRTAIQLSEEGFERLLQGMIRAGDQLHILKERIYAAAPDAKAPRKG
jgi:hypothetical protein